jgi:C1A family cysteine protease
MTGPKRSYGYRPDLPDFRDHIAAVSHALAHKLPRQVDLRAGMPPVYDQGELGSCTGNALAAAVQHADPERGQPSRLFIYYAERVIEHTVAHDAGACIRDGIKALASVGVCAEAEWPYDVAKFKTKPAAKCYEDAQAGKIAAYHRITSLSTLKASLAAGHPVVIGFTAYESFESEEVANTGVLELPAEGESVLGGHAVLVVGYDDDAERVIVRNSWGAEWGQAGYFTMPYAYLTNPGLAADFWQIVK